MPMPTLPPAMIAIVAPFAPLFSRRVWHHAEVLLAGALLAPAQRTVTAALRVMGLAQLRQFHRYHRVLSRDHWSSLAAGRVLLRLLVAVADSSDAALDFLAACGAWRSPVTVITRLRLDAALYEPAPPRRPRQTGRPRLKGKRLPTLAAVAAEMMTCWTAVTVAHWYGA